MADQANILSPGGTLQPYEGKNLSLHDQPYCRSCNAEEKEGVSLLRCTRCKLMYYCSRECQKEDFPNHKRVCRKIQRQVDVVEREAKKLRDIVISPLQLGRENLFETCKGEFWDVFETRDYIRSRLMLASFIYSDIALRYETKNAWEAVVEHYQEILRLCELDNLVLRFRFPFLLLHLNRDDDAFDFCRDWCIEVDPEERELLHINSQEGDWIYGHEKDCRYLEIFEECPDERPHSMCLPLLVAVAVIKMRIVATHDARKKSLELFQLTSSGEKLSPVQSVITSILEGDDTFRAKMEDQRAQLNRLLDQIHLNNPTMLSALLNPYPLLEQGDPDELVIGDPSEVYFILRDAYDLWHRIPGAKEQLEARCGHNPTYSTF
jgi:hypothetical protein